VKESLRPSIRTMVIATARTGLRSMPRINSDHGNASCLRLVLDKRVQLSKTPTMQPTLVLNILLLFASSHLRSLSDMSQILKDESTSRGGILNNALREDVIVIAVQPKLFLAQLFEVTLSRASAFSLQFPLEAEDATFLLFPSLLTQEVTVGSHSRAVKSEVYSDHFLRRNDSRFRKGNHDMKGETALPVAQIRATHLVTNILPQVSGNRERQLHTPIHGSNATGERLPLHPVRTLVIADTDQLTVRTTNGLENRERFALLPGFFNPLRVCLFLLDLPCQSGFHGFRRFDTSRTNQLSRKVRVLSPKGIVRPFVQLYAVATTCRKSFTTDGIKAGSILLKRCLEAVRLLWRGLQLDNYCSIHTESISYIPGYCQHEKGEGAFLPTPLGRGLLRL